MERGLALRQVRAVVLCTALACSSLYAQGKANQSANSGTMDEYPDLVELDAFGGCSIFGAVVDGIGEKLVNGGTAGGRVTLNFSKYLGVELGYNFMINNVELSNPLSPGLPTTYNFYNFGDQIHYPALNLVANLKPRGSRVQPYLTVGVGPAIFNPTAAAEAHARLVDPTYHSANLKDNLQVALNYGGGVKFHLSEHFGLRLDVRGFWFATRRSGCRITTTAESSSSEGNASMVFRRLSELCFIWDAAISRRRLRASPQLHFRRPPSPARKELFVWANR